MGYIYVFSAIQRVDALIQGHFEADSLVLRSIDLFLSWRSALQNPILGQALIRSCSISLNLYECSLLPLLFVCCTSLIGSGNSIGNCWNSKREDRPDKLAQAPPDDNFHDQRLCVSCLMCGSTLYGLVLNATSKSIS